MKMPSESTSTERYLREVRRHLAPATPDVRDALVLELAEDIRQSGTSDEDLTQRYGSPADIARDLLQSEAEPIATSSNPVGRASLIGPLFLAVGQILLPLIGWVVGVVLISMSRAWRPREKLLLLIGPIGGGLGGVIGLLNDSSTSRSGEIPGYGGPTIQDPDRYLFVSSSIVPLVIANVVIAVVLIVISIRRSRQA